MGAPLNISGDQYGRLTVIERAPNVGRYTAWLCQCECGERVVTKTMCLTRGDTKSCGCLTRDRVTARNTTHGLSIGRNGKRRRLYWLWSAMRQRCSNPSHRSYVYYGGRGIRVCDEWQDYAAFHEWAVANGYERGLTIDRIDNGGDYEPSNCRWITKSENSRRAMEARWATGSSSR